MMNNARLITGRGSGDGAVEVGSSVASSLVGWTSCGLCVEEGVSMDGDKLGVDGAQAVVKLARIRTATMTAVEHHLSFFMITFQKA